MLAIGPFGEGERQFADRGERGVHGLKVSGSKGFKGTKT